MEALQILVTSVAWSGYHEFLDAILNKSDPMWPELPLEFNVVGTPVTLQSVSARAKGEWKAKVRDTALGAVEPGSWSFETNRLGVTMFYFPQETMTGDLDNIVKLTLDALSPNIYLDDNLIDRLVVQRFDPGTGATFAFSTDTLVAAMASDEPVLYIRITDAPIEDVAT